MIKKGTWIIILIFVVLVVGLLLIEKYPVGSLKATPTATMQPSLFNNVPFDQIVKLEINSDSSKINLEKIGDTWVLAEKRSATISQSRVAELLVVLLSLDSASSPDPTTPLEALGLTIANQKFVITANNTEYVLSIGDMTPTGGGYYARVNQGNPLIITNYAGDSLKRFIALEYLLAETPVPDAIGQEQTVTP